MLILQLLIVEIKKGSACFSHTALVDKSPLFLIRITLMISRYCFYVNTHTLATYCPSSWWLFFIVFKKRCLQICMLSMHARYNFCMVGIQIGK